MHRLTRTKKKSSLQINQSLTSLFGSQMDEQIGIRISKESGVSLQKSLQALLGLKKYLTPDWIESVSHIIRGLPSAKSFAEDSLSKNRILEVTENDRYDDPDAKVSALNIQGDTHSLNNHLKQLTIQRRQFLNDFLDLKGNIRVFCRIRPYLQNESDGYLRPVINSDSSNVYVKYGNSKTKQYSFDKIFLPESTQEEIFSEVEPVINSALDGYNVCIFAYGQTGSGKTFTMEGRRDCPGVVQHGLQALFNQAIDSSFKYLLTFSMLEIYMGNLRDLLVPRTKGRVSKASSLSIQLDANGGIEIDNLSAVEVSDFDEVKRLYKFGIQTRSTASTKSNRKSSRSHCLIRITISSLSANERRRVTNKLWMVDLGGSERLLKTQARGRIFEEGKTINLSLSALGDVIYALQHKRSHIPYRNSKLTQVLRDSLGSDSKVLMLVHVSPKEKDLCETMCSLGFATRVRSIHLGQGESDQMRSKKELEMAELLEKLKSSEDECRVVGQKIKELSTKLRKITRSELKGSGVTGTSFLSVTEPQLQEVRNRNEGSSCPRSSAGLPRFMRPTICSQRKAGSCDNSSLSTQKEPPFPSKKKAASVYAESPISRAKNFFSQSDSDKDCSLSTETQLYWNSSDNECSNSVLGYETENMILQEENSPRSIKTPVSVESMHELDYSQMVKHSATNNPIVKYVPLNETREETLTYSKLNKRSVSCSEGDATFKCKVQNVADTCEQTESTDILPCLVSITSHQVEMEKYFSKKQVYYDTLKHFDSATKTGCSHGNEKEAVNNYYQISNFNEKVIPKVIPDENIEELPVITKDIGVDDRPSVWSSGATIEIVRPEETKTLLNRDNGCLKHSEHYAGEVDEMKLHHMKAQRSLLMSTDQLILDTNSAPPDEPTNIPQRLQGFQELLKKTIQTLCLLALLGLGIESVGFDHDFYFGLML